MNAGEIKISLLLENKVFAEQIKTSLSLLKIFKTNATDILKGIPVTFETGEIDKELQKEEQTLKRLQTEIEKTDTQSKQFNQTQEHAAVTTTKLSGVLVNAGLRYDGFRAVISTLQATFRSLILDYEKQEVALSKLENGLKNVGEGAGALNNLSSQASELQKITPFADEDINNAQAMLTTFQKNSEEIEILTPRILDLAAAYQTSGESGMDLQQIAVMLGKVNEETIGGLRRVGVAFSKEQEEKLKSLRGTEQAIYLSKILDSNFKGMAETLGNTTAGKVVIFKNQVGELRESFGKMLAEGLLPILTPLKTLVESLNNAHPFFQRLTLGAIALGAAFVVLNTSMGGLPYIIGALVTAFYAFNSVGEITAAMLKKTNEATLRSKEVSSEMKVVLDNLKISANNMAEAYDGIANSIGSMTKTQLLSTKAFIEAEKAKVLALVESMKAMRLNDLAKMDFVPPDFGKSIENAYTIGFAPELDRLTELLNQIDSKLKFVPDESSGSQIKSGTSKSSDDTEKFTSSLEELEKQLAEVQTRIDKQTEGENIVEKLYGKKKEIEEMIRMIKEINELGVIGYGKKIHQAEIDKGIKLPERRIGGTFGEGALDDIKPLDVTEDARVTFKDKLDASLGLASQITSILGLGADNFINKFIGGLRDGIGLVTSIAKFLRLIGSGGSPGFLSFLGFASGGEVPGSGSGDSVPAMLTPGEYVIKKSRASMLGTRFLNWLNGGGSVQSLAPGAFSSYGSSKIIEVPYILNYRIKGNDLESIMTKAKKTNARRSL